VNAAELERRDRDTRGRAQREFVGPLVVEAGAGTGKTSILVARIAAWALGPGWERAAARLEAAAADSPPGPDDVARDVLSRVCAITFTEAAAAEMELRSGRALREVAAGGSPVGLDPDVLPPRPARRERAEALGEALEHLGVRTIHAYCRRILARHPLEAGLHPSFQVDADAGVQADVVREVVERAVRQGYGADADPTLLELAAEGIGAAELEEALLELVADGVPPQALDADPLAPARVDEYRAHLEAALAALEAAHGGRLAGVPRNATRTHAVLEVVEASRRALANGDGLEALVEALRDPWAEARGRLGEWSRGKFKGVESSCLAGAADGLRRAAAQLLSLVEILIRFDPLLLERARRALAPMLAEAQQELRVRGFASFASLLRDARDLLADHPTLRAEVRAGIDQLLVDEFQDTDPIQCEIVRMLALEGEGRPGLFLVGDPKQSIYGWRRADLRAYDDFVTEVEPDRAARGLLSRNFRSLPALLDEVECVVAPVMREQRGVQPAFQPLVASNERRAASPPPGRAAVEHWISWAWNAEAGAPETLSAARTAELEARALARDLRDLHDAGDLAWSDAGILFRGTGDLETYLRELRSAGVPYAVERERTYYQRREIVEAAALLQCVLDPLDALALLATLRSAWVGVPDAALLPLWRHELPPRVTSLRGPDDEAIADLDRRIDAALSELPDGVPGMERVAGWEANLRWFVRSLAVLRQSFAREPVDRFVEKLRTLTLLEAGEAGRFLGAYRVANLDRFFRELRAELEAGGDAHALLRRLRRGVAEGEEAEGGRPAEAAEDAVRVMTIHKAKGLDFRHTYLVQLHKKPGGRGADRRRIRVGYAQGRSEYLLFGAPTLGHHAVQSQIETVEAAERVRTLYVAMTRARDRLVLLGQWPLQPPEEPVEAERAASYAELLQRRAGLAPALVERMVGLAGSGGDHDEDETGVRWRFPGLTAMDLAARPAAAFADVRPVAGRAASEWHELRAQAQARMGRPYRATASADAHAGVREEQAERRFGAGDAVGAEAPRVDVEAARVAGTAVHRILEDFDLEVESRAELERQRARLPALVKALAGPALRGAAEARAAAVLDRLGSGDASLLGRLRGLRQRIVARELPVLLPPPETPDGPVGFLAGALDLVYRDPASDELVVADYKTDAVLGAAELGERVRRYGSQGKVYQRALREAFALAYTPRFELWMLWAGEVVAVG
jgi:ATP-dependent helicase/nuclease subunit A